MNATRFISLPQQLNLDYRLASLLFPVKLGEEIPFFLIDIDKLILYLNFTLPKFILKKYIVRGFIRAKVLCLKVNF